MNHDELKDVFDRMAAGYDSKSARIAPVYDALHFLMASVLGSLPTHARVLCIGVGTGSEMIHLAHAFPGWRFTAVEPSSAMIEVCRRRMAEAGFSERCDFIEGYVESVPESLMHDAATCLLVSQFMLDPDDRSDFFRQIALRVTPGGILVNADLSFDTGSSQFDEALAAWQRLSTGSDDPDERARMRAGYERDVAILSAQAVEAIIAAGGFHGPVPFFQSSLIRGWFARRRSTVSSA